MEKWFGTEVVHDSPFPSDVWMAVMHYRDLAEDGLELDRLRADSLAVADDGQVIELLIQLAAFRESVERDRDLLIGPDYLLDRLAEWRSARTNDPDNTQVQRNVHLDMPIDAWVRTAWEATTMLLSTVTETIEQVRASVPRATSSSSLVPESYSPLAKLLLPYRDEFISPIPDVVHAFRNRSGTIVMHSSTKSVGALLLEAIRVGLGINDASVLARLTVHFPMAVKVNDIDSPKPWFTKRNELANLVNTTRSGARPHHAFVLMDMRMSSLIDDITKMLATLDDPSAY